jgi:hypothetical protein
LKERERERQKFTPSLKSIHSFNIIENLLYYGNVSGITTKIKFGSFPKGKEFTV